MDETYDAIVLGTGLKECILSALLSVSGKKILHIDRSKYYGYGASSITPLEDFLSKFNVPMSTRQCGRARDFDVDLIPKFIMSNGPLVKLLIDPGVTRFASVEGSYVYKDGKIFKVPVFEGEVLSSDLLWRFEKEKFKNFLCYVQEHDVNDPKTWKDFDARTMTTLQLYEKFGLLESTEAITGHAMALWRDDEYLNMPAQETMRRIKLYCDCESLARYGKSPYLYPMYGSGELPQGFTRLSAIYGGTHTLDTRVDEILYSDGKVCGVRSGEHTIKCSQVYCDPNYVSEKVRQTGQVVRCICVMDHPVPRTRGALSAQIIIPRVNRRSDIYVSVVSYKHHVAAKESFVAMVSTTVETANPKKEIRAGLALL